MCCIGLKFKIVTQEAEYNFYFLFVWLKNIWHSTKPGNFFLNCWDVVFDSVIFFSTAETLFLKLSIFPLTVETFFLSFLPQLLRRCFWNCQFYSQLLELCFDYYWSRFLWLRLFQSVFSPGLSILPRRCWYCEDFWDQLFWKCWFFLDSQDQCQD